MIKKIKFISIPVLDQDRALKFYTEKLGFSVVQDVPFGENKRWIELKVKGAETGVVLFTPDGHEDRVGSFMNLGWLTDDIEKTCREFQERGVELMGPPQQMDWGQMVIFKDSEGNSHCLSQMKPVSCCCC